ncbi:hypothetical protein GCM10009630_64090 [Kribbella jejuensis]|uniref:Uncharacterized protein n=1 Tax=Kribbella jejuensis TaxID=236068 RepID=A0A542ESJ4_9ACTN|nr:hypothetical protein [Kribbella jejuensis]TQJ18136.1 hypothetical protein FB475_2271 [Kribbella jejuensis]
MSWQLWVLITLAAAGLVLLAAARMRHARKVFDDITGVSRPAPRREPEPDELARARARHLDAEPKRRHG